MDRLRRTAPPASPTVEAILAAVAGFLLGAAARPEWPALDWLFRLFPGN